MNTIIFSCLKKKKRNWIWLFKLFPRLETTDFSSSEQSISENGDWREAENTFTKSTTTIGRPSVNELIITRLTIHSISPFFFLSGNLGIFPNYFIQFSTNLLTLPTNFKKISPQIPLTTRSFKFWRKIRSNQVAREVGAGRRDRKMAIQHGGGGEERGRCTTCPISTERDLSGKKRTQWNPRDRHYKAFLLPLNARHSMAHLSICKPSQQKKHFLIPNILLT